MFQGAWVAQLAERQNSAQAIIFWFVGLSRTWSWLLSACLCAEPALDPLFPPLSLPLLLWRMCSLSQKISKIFKKIKNISKLHSNCEL